MIIIFLIILLILAIIYLIYINNNNEYRLKFYSKNNDSFLKIYENILTNEECEELINKYKDKCTNSRILDLNESTFSNNIRSSSDYNISSKDDKIIEKLEKKISKLINIPVNNFEKIQFVNYKKGGFYNEHYDFYNNAENDRIMTFLIYLNTLEDEGYTEFPYYNKKIKPEQGNGICFKNIINNKNNYHSLHKGCEIKSDNNKYILSLWIRKYNVK